MAGVRRRPFPLIGMGGAFFVGKTEGKCNLRTGISISEGLKGGKTDKKARFVKRILKKQPKKRKFLKFPCNKRGIVLYY